MGNEQPNLERNGKERSEGNRRRIGTFFSPGSPRELDENWADKGGGKWEGGGKNRNKSRKLKLHGRAERSGVVAAEMARRVIDVPNRAKCFSTRHLATPVARIV